jgi:acetate kinase
MVLDATGAWVRRQRDRAARGEPDARLALDVYVHHLRAGIASMDASLGGLDVLVFTGGVGANASTVRAAAAERLGMLGTVIDPTANSAAQGDGILSPPGAEVATVVVDAREDLEIARQVRGVLNGG